MKTKTTKPATTVADLRTPQEKLEAQKASALRMIASKLQWNIEQAQDVVTSMKEKLTTINSAIYELSWLNDRAMNLAYGELCEGVNYYKDRDPCNGDVVQAVKYVLDECTRKLMSNELRGSSTSAFSNAMEGATREAASRFVRDFQPLVDYATATEV